MSILPLPGDLVRDSIPGSHAHRVCKVVDGFCFLSCGGAIAIDKAILVQRGPAHQALALHKARAATGMFSGKKFEQGDPVKVTGQVPNKGKRGKIAMLTDNGHVVTHSDGSHYVYDEKCLSHDDQGEDS